MEKSLRKTRSTADLLAFIIPSLIGLFFFMIPISYNGDITIPIAVLSGFVQNLLGDLLPGIMTVIIVLTLAGTLLAKSIRPEIFNRNHFLKTLFDVPLIWLIARFLGAIFAVLTFLKIGPEAVWSENTGGLLLYDLLPILFSVFLFAGLFLPLLLNFGLLELFGT